MKKIVVTAGAKGADIDVLACATAYAELLKLEGHNAAAVVPGNFTASVTPAILEWEAEFLREYDANKTESFVLVDISDPNHIPDFVNIEAVIEVYDHRHGHEGFWQERLTRGFHIEMVGACGTLIWEEFKKREHSENIRTSSARLLLASIVSNTLNFRSSLTTERDKAAYDELKAKADLPRDWIETYFQEQERELLANFKQYLQNDTKTLTVKGEDFVIGQLEMWDATHLLAKKQNEIYEVMQRYNNTPWMVNIINISHGHNYIYSNNQNAREVVERKLEVTFNGSIAKTEKLLMRKEITKILNS